MKDLTNTEMSLLMVIVLLTLIIFTLSYELYNKQTPKTKIVTKIECYTPIKHNKGIYNRIKCPGATNKQ